MLLKFGFICFLSALIHISNAENTAESSFSKIRCARNSVRPGAKQLALVLLKPDAVQRKLVGKIIGRFENKGLQLVAMKMLTATKEMVADHYIEHKECNFFDSLIAYMTATPVIPMIWEGPNAIAVIRNMLGVHDPLTSHSGTIRGDFAIDVQYNVIHGSDSIESTRREIDIWFPENTIKPNNDEL